MKSHKLSVVFSLFAGALLLTACQSNDKQKETTPPPAKPTPAPVTAAPPTMDSSVTMKEGVAGGVTEDVVTVETVVTAVDAAGRKVTLKGPEGREYSFDVNPQIKDLSALKVGDKVTATLGRRVFIGVRRDDAPASDTYEETWVGAAPATSQADWPLRNPRRWEKLSPSIR